MAACLRVWAQEYQNECVCVRVCEREREREQRTAEECPNGCNGFSLGFKKLTRLVKPSTPTDRSKKKFN